MKTVDEVIEDLQEKFREWNDCTGALYEHGNWFYEAQSFIDDAVRAGLELAAGVADSNRDRRWMAQDRDGWETSKRIAREIRALALPPADSVRNGTAAE